MALAAPIRHAVEVTQELRFRYLCFNTLGIVQDDAGDWETEASRMSDVYQGATLTIAASESDERCSGLFWHRSIKIETRDFQNAVLMTSG